LTSTTNLNFAAGSITGTTRWTSNTTANTSNATDPDNRIRVLYDSVSSFQVAVGAGGNGLAYFFLEFASGINFPNTTQYYQVTGNILNDTNGLHGDAIVNGTPVHTVSSTQLYASLVNANDSIIESAAIMSDGSYSFNVVPDGGYTVLLSTSMLTVNSTGNTSSIPSLWAFTGENIGTGSGNDGSANGEIAITVNGANVVQANIGINAAPDSETITRPILMPSYGDTLTVASENDPFGSGFGPSPFGTDNEDGTIDPSTIYITSLPTGTNELLYNGTQITLGGDGTNPPSASNPLIITSFDYTLLQFVIWEAEEAEFDYAIIDAAGLVDQTPATYNYFWTGAVPVELIDFKVRKTSDQAELVWSTASELNNDRFEIERKTENGIDFMNIGTVKGAGNSNSILEYSYSDDVTKLSGSVCYRLKQIDYDGQFAYSDAQCVFMSPKTQVVIYPNPTKGIVSVKVDSELDNDFVELTSLDGRTIEKKSISNNGTITFNTENIENGIYFIKVSNRYGVTATRVIVN
jgi:hypothetical protein